MVKNTKEEQEMKESIDETETKLVTNPGEVGMEIYAGTANLGTEEVTSDDLNTPYLKVIQPNTQNIENKKDGWFYRPETQQQMETVEVNLVYVTTKEVDNYSQTAKEKVKVYYGFYAGSTEPFRLFIRTKSWSGAAHREFQTLVEMYKNKLKIPMFALTVKLDTEKVSGTLPPEGSAATGKPYTTYKIVFDVVKEKGDFPLIEKDVNRIGFLADAVERFKQVSQASEMSFAEEIESR